MTQPSRKRTRPTPVVPVEQQPVEPVEPTDTGETLDEQPASEPTLEPTTGSAPESAPKPALVEEITAVGKKYFNEVKRLIPHQYDGDPQGDLPLQSR